MADDDCKRTIYLLLDPRNEAVRYVGVTRHSLSTRLNGHMQEALRTANDSHRVRWVRQLIALGLRPKIVAHCSVLPGAQWQLVEIDAVAYFRAAGAKLVNGTVGGDGTTGRVWRPTEEQRKRMSEGRVGRIPSEETRARRSATLKKFYEDPDRMAKRQEMARRAARSPKGRARASAHLKALWANPEWRAKMRAAISARQKGKIIVKPTRNLLSDPGQAQGSLDL